MTWAAVIYAGSDQLAQGIGVRTLPQQCRNAHHIVRNRSLLWLNIATRADSKTLDSHPSVTSLARKRPDDAPHQHYPREPLLGFGGSPLSI